VTAQGAERTVVLAMRLLAVAFAVTGVLFIAAPDGVIDTIGDVGAEIGDFAPGADSDQRLWLGLAFAYMVVITGIALVVQSDVARFRPLLLVLAAGKAASSLAAGAFFVLEEDVFAYLVNFVVDGGLVAVALWCWALAGRVAQPAPAMAGDARTQAVQGSDADTRESGEERPAGAEAARG
jgi:hypothetical protein